MEGKKAERPSEEEGAKVEGQQTQPDFPVVGEVYLPSNSLDEQNDWPKAHNEGVQEAVLDHPYQSPSQVFRHAIDFSYSKKRLALLTGDKL